MDASIDESVEEKWQEVVDDKSDTAWVLAGYEGKKITVKGSGCGGRSECLAAITDDTAVFFGACECLLHAALALETFFTCARVVLPRHLFLTIQSDLTPSTTEGPLCQLGPSFVFSSTAQPTRRPCKRRRRGGTWGLSSRPFMGANRRQNKPLQHIAKSKGDDRAFSPLPVMFHT